LNGFTVRRYARRIATTVVARRRLFPTDYR
jgi:hypothetical protein